MAALLSAGPLRGRRRDVCAAGGICWLVGDLLGGFQFMELISDRCWNGDLLGRIPILLCMYVSKEVQT